MVCQLRIQVINDGWSDVTVTAVGLLEMGSDNVYGLRAQFVNPNGQEPIDTPEINAALFDIMGGITVPAGAMQSFTAFFDYEGGAQMSECTSAGLRPPVVRVTALGATRDVRTPAEDTIWFQMGGFDECGEDVQ